MGREVERCEAGGSHGAPRRLALQSTAIRRPPPPSRAAASEAKRSVPPHHRHLQPTPRRAQTLIPLAPPSAPLFVVEAEGRGVRRDVRRGGSCEAPSPAPLPPTESAGRFG
eukprot:CAMPEP_0184392864 /NCGR_PEP_ID=MMETSP0007-20130409/30614_1 /TAXON_ID=97485 /ORGANISM="Prymnesium parvum, Strain Texoma1" /LENGTH=110 /DNA_ID=CAMNT_0026743601 /DNA_START=623 /DNA_END=952 /DNA_ORIENTATION=-